MAASSTGGPSWSIPSAERVKYDQIFDGLQPVAGLLTGDQVKPVLLNSKLPVDVLSRVWELSDIDGDGMLDRDEFTVAMHLVYRALEKNPVPATIPPDMVPPSKRRTAGVLLPGAPVPGLPGALPPDPMSPPIAGPVPAGGVGTKWVVSPTDKLKYDEMFRQADTDMDGYVNGAEIKDIFLQSGLSPMVLAHIWNLCDTTMMGKLNSDQFALAVYLVQQKLLGTDPPAQLPLEMIPPSLRCGNDGGLSTVAALPSDPAGMKELDILSRGIEDLKHEKMKLEQEKAQREADIKIRNGEVMSLQKELDALSHTVMQLELQRGEAQKRLDELDDKRAKLEASVTECKEKFHDEQKQIQDLRYQITNRESIVTNQEAELQKMKDEIGLLRQKETDLEQKVETEQQQTDQFTKKLAELRKEIEQTNFNVENLQAAEKALNASIGQYDALLRNEISEDQLEPMSSDSSALAFTAQPSISPSVSGAASNAFGSSSFENVKQEPFGTRDPFFNSAAVSEADPFRSEDPFANIGSNGVFQSGDPFVDGADPFGSDPFKDPFGGGGAELERPPSGFGAGAAGFSTVSSSLRGSARGASGGDPWGASFPASNATSVDNFDPFGSASVAHSRIQSHPNDPFGSGSFDPVPRYPATLHSSMVPVLPPKQKKAPAPPRPPAPKPASGFHGGFDMMGAFENHPTGGPVSSLPGNNKSPSLSKFSTGKLSSEAEQLAWAKRDSKQEYERLRRLREQEQADLELAIALSRQELSSGSKS